jgi:hypothetical protein
MAILLNEDSFVPALEKVASSFVGLVEEMGINAVLTAACQVRDYRRREEKEEKGSKEEKGKKKKGQVLKYHFLLPPTFTITLLTVV